MKEALRKANPFEFPVEASVQVSEGPMELGIQIEGSRESVQAWAGNAAGVARKLLSEISSFYPLLRMRGKDLFVKARWPKVIQRMVRAVQRVAPEVLTPMAAVAGALSEELLNRMLVESPKPLTRVIVNNGGDMAVYSPYSTVHIGIRGCGMRDCVMHLPARPTAYGIATSGWRGRSFSQGIADAVVVVAQSSAVADAAATHIGNHVMAEGIRGIEQKRAGTLDPETDIPDLLVTVTQGSLSLGEKRRALEHACRAARPLLKERVIEGVRIYLQGERVVLPATASGSLG